MNSTKNDWLEPDNEYWYLEVESEVTFESEKGEVIKWARSVHFY